MHYCDYVVDSTPEDGLVACGKPSRCHFRLPSGRVRWLCAEHYDTYMEVLRLPLPWAGKE